MAAWQAVRRISALLDDDPYWQDRFRQLSDTSVGPYGLHVAVFIEPFLQYILEGRKTVESRFSVRRCPPYHQVNEGDVILLKHTGGPIVGVCEVSDVWFYDLNPRTWADIRRRFAEALCAEDPSFWTGRRGASFGTLMRIDHVRRFTPVPFPKRDRRGWVVMQAATLSDMRMQ